MQVLKIMLLGVLASLLVACGGGGTSDDRKSIDLSLTYFIQPHVARFKYYATDAPNVTYTPNDKVFSVDSGAGYLPPGESLNTDNGIVSGVPTTPGSYTTQIKLNVKGYTGSTEVFYRQTVQDLLLTTGGNQTWAAGTSFVLYSASLEAGIDIVKNDPAHGVKVTYQMASGSTLPAGLTLDPATGLVTGFSSVKAGVYPNIFYQATVTYQGLSYVYNAPAVTYTVNGSV
jgi:hypothetical protein